MKILTADQIREADSLTIKNQKITSIDLMERAATQAYLWLKNKFPDKETQFHIFCGQGNNGGDGLVIARLLKNDGLNVVLDIAGSAGRPTEDFNVNMEKALAAGLTDNSKEIYPYNNGKLVVVDAIFGIGLSREPDDEVKLLIERINTSRAVVVSVDVPSGMFMDRPTAVAVKSDYVLTFQQPKLAFYLPGNYPYIKTVDVLNIGLDGEYLEQASTNYFLIDHVEAVKRFRPMQQYAHKGTQGHALVIGGSHGKIGAVCLASKAALKSGSGLVTAYLPECGYNIIQSFFPEAMALTNGTDFIDDISFSMKPDAIGIGPGMGQEPETQSALSVFLENVSSPLVIDADALNILAQHKEWLSNLPENTILTPHPKELQRLMGNWDNDFDKIEKLKTFAKQYNIVVVAKDARTLITDGEQLYINSTGNAGLATGGTGDVLTGIITGLLAQGYPPLDTAVFGVYLHGLSADIGVKQISAQSFTATDLIANIGTAYKEIETNCP